MLAWSRFAAGSTVSFGANLVPDADYQVVSATQITASAPAGAAGTVQVRVSNPDGQSTPSTPAAEYTYLAPPTITDSYEP